MNGLVTTQAREGIETIKLFGISLIVPVTTQAREGIETLIVFPCA